MIDIFAGPGGLSEGFASFVPPKRKRPSFSVRLSIEADQAARQTLMLRSFYRQFRNSVVPDSYYSYVRGEIGIEELRNRYPRQFKNACSEAWQARLGEEDVETVRERIDKALGGSEQWVLLGGPPCQAYSMAGRSRMKPGLGADFDLDHRHFLYKEYLRILADHIPAVFIFENVKGLLSSTIGNRPIFHEILSDLQNPARVIEGSRESRSKPRYRLYSLNGDSIHSDGQADPKEFIVRSERHGVPQRRHRLIIVGVLEDLTDQVGGAVSLESRSEVCIQDVIEDLPRIRSGVSKPEGDLEHWLDALVGYVESGIEGYDHRVFQELKSTISDVTLECQNKPLDQGVQFSPYVGLPKYRPDWFMSDRMGGVTNHLARNHMRSDLHRYLFLTAFAQINKRSAMLKDFPESLLPQHKNAKRSARTGHFGDRFRVQSRDRAATTITSHIAKDGHYFIHFDGTQCRSLTVREAARIQTFPDDYHFEGNRTQQYVQVGNAVPPLLAVQIAERVFEIIKNIHTPAPNVDAPAIPVEHKV